MELSEALNNRKSTRHYIDKKVDNENYIETEVDSETGEQTQLLTARYGLRYDELIADLIATVQSLNNRLKALEQ